MGIKAILTDIEGTTTSLSFVKDVLFPYADRHMGAFIQNHAREPGVAALLADVCREPDASCQPDDVPALVQQLRGWIAADKKVSPLKSIQGLLWAHGYRQGDFTGHVYPDAAHYLRQWHAQGLHLYVYSSGSVHAQQLLFAYSDAGDLTPLFSGYFDTGIGHKQEAGSYRQIVAELGLPAGQILFLSDVAAELDAAALAGMQTYCLVRENQPLAGVHHRWATRFDDISID